MKKYSFRNLIAAAMVSSAVTASAVLALTAGNSIINAGSAYNADVNGDGQVNVMDLNIIKNIVLDAESGEEKVSVKAVSVKWLGKDETPSQIWNAFEQTEKNTVFTAGEDILNFIIYNVTYDENMNPDYKAVSTLEKFEKGSSFAAGLEYAGSFPNIAVSWIDSDGKTCMYFVSESGKDGSLILSETKKTDGTGVFTEEFLPLEGYWFADGDTSLACFYISREGWYEARYADGNTEYRGQLKKEFDDGEPYLCFCKDSSKVFSVPFTSGMTEFTVKNQNGSDTVFKLTYGAGGAMDDGRGPDEE